MENTISSTSYYSNVLAKDYTTSSASRTSDNSTGNTSISQQSDTISLSEESVSKYNAQKENEDSSAKTSATSKVENTELSSEEIKELQKLQQRDAEVKAHEQAHLSTAGQYAAGGASFSYTTGPNGKKYATGGEVPIDLSKEKDPQTTIAKMAQVRRAALAPATPSAVDRNIAARASMIAAEATRELNSTAGSTVDNDESSQNSSQNDDDNQKTSIVSSTESGTLAASDNIIPSHTRHRILQAYAAHS